jgi:branched-chain amino acid transport system permease protein
MAEILIYGSVTSAVYALLAVGFTLIFGVARIVNLAHGAFYAFAAYFAYICVDRLGLPIYAAFAASIVATMAFGMLLEVLIIRPMRDSHLLLIMITLAISLLVEQSLVATFSREARNIPPLVTGTVEIFGVSTTAQRVLTVIASVVLISMLFLFIQKTKIGLAILAISQDAEAAEYVGVPSSRVFLTVMALSSGLAASAALLASPFLSVEPGMGLVPMVKAFTIVIVGGLGSITGSIVAAIIIGFLETFISFEFSAAWADAAAVAAVFVTLIARPAGLFGKRELFQ